MSNTFLVSLAVVVALLFGARFLVRALPVPFLARRITFSDATLAGLGIVALVFHCVAMFFPEVVEPIPGTRTLSDEIRAMGTSSIMLYAVPAAAVMLGFRRHHPAALVTMGLSLAAVGYTMYNGGPLDVHLATIFISVVVIAAVSATLTLPPWTPRPRPTVA